MELIKFNSYVDIPVVYKPSIQRDVVPHRIGGIKEYIISKINTNKNVVLGALILAKLDKVLYLIDGQHRLKAIEELYEESKTSVPICAIIYNCVNKSELTDIFKSVNSGVPVPQFLLDDPESEQTIMLKSIYEKLNKEKGFDVKRKNRPYVNINDFIEELKKSKLLQLCVDVKDVYNAISIVNEVVKNYVKDSKYVKRNTISNNMLEKCAEWDNYLGLDKNCSYMNDENVLHHVENYLRTQMQTNDVKIDEKINEVRHKWNVVERQQIWHNYIGAERGRVLCPLCKTNTIEPLNYVVGHVISLYNNGSDTIRNVRPICNICNSSMGKNNMDLNKYTLEGI